MWSIFAVTFNWTVYVHLQMASKPSTFSESLNCIGFVEGSTVSANQALLSDLEVLDGGYLAMSGRINGAATPIIGNKSPQAGSALPYLHWHYAPTVAHSQEDPVWKSFPVTSVTLCKVSCVGRYFTGT